MSATPGRDLDAVIEDLLPPQAEDSESLDDAAGKFDEIARVLSEALSRAQG